MVTDRPVYNTTDTGTIEFDISKDSITLLLQHPLSALTIKDCILQDIEAKRDFDTIKILDLNGLAWTDQDVNRIQALPRSLQRLNVEGNNWSNTSLHRLINLFLLCNNAAYLVLEIKDSKAVALIKDFNLPEAR